MSRCLPIRETESPRRERADSGKWWNRVSRPRPGPPHIFALNHSLFAVDLDVGIPLPKVLNVNFANAVLEIIEVSFLCNVV